jgi:hypothetical protein
MYVTHHAFRRDAAAFRSALDEVAFDERDRWHALRDRWQVLASALHHHHVGEDEGLWPVLRERAESAGDVSGRVLTSAMEAEHGDMAPVLDACSANFATMTESPTSQAHMTLRRSVGVLVQMLESHLDHEERDAMALVQRYLDNATWLQIELQHFGRSYSRSELMTIIPWGLEGLPDDVLSEVLASGGPSFAGIWRRSRRSFARRQAAAFGSTQHRPRATPGAG